MKKVVFSIIIPIYNAEKYLRHCLDSIVMQTDRSYEVLLIDDGSTDKSGYICDCFVAEHEQFRIIHKKNAGVSSARNTGIELAKGEYLVFVDSDDFLSNNYLSSIHDIIDKKQPDVIVNSSYYIYSEENCQSDTYRIKDYDEITSEIMTSLLLERDYPSAVWMSVYKRDLLEKHKLDESIHFYEDLDFQLSLVESVNSIFIHKSPGYYYRSGSVTHSKFSEKTVSCYGLIEKLHERKVEDCKVDRLEAEFVVSNALIAAQDRTKHEQLDLILRERAKRLKKSVFVKKDQNLHKWIKMIALSPKIFYTLYRIKHR